MLKFSRCTVLIFSSILLSTAYAKPVQRNISFYNIQPISSVSKDFCKGLLGDMNINFDADETGHPTSDAAVIDDNRSVDSYKLTNESSTNRNWSGRLHYAGKVVPWTATGNIRNKQMSGKFSSKQCTANFKSIKSN